MVSEWTPDLQPVIWTHGYFDPVGALEALVGIGIRRSPPIPGHPFLAGKADLSTHLMSLSGIWLGGRAPPNTAPAIGSAAAAS